MRELCEKRIRINKLNFIFSFYSFMRNDFKQNLYQQRQYGQSEGPERN